MVYVIESKQSKKSYIKEFKNKEEAKDWVINHLDLSLNWIVRLKSGK